MRDTIASIIRHAQTPLLTVLDGLEQTALDWKPAPDSRSIGEVARHVLRVDNTFLKRLGEGPRIDDPGEVDAPTIARALREQQEQVLVLIAERDDAWLSQQAGGDAKNGETHADVLLHMAQHHLYHFAQIVYLRRALDREWKAPLDAWESATHVIGDAILARS